MATVSNDISLSVQYENLQTILYKPFFWLISTNGDGFGFGSLGRRSIPKIGTVTIRETIHTGIRKLNRNQWKKLCIIQCNDRAWNPNPSPNPLVEISQKNDCKKAASSYQSVCALVRSSCERFMMTVPISHLAELNMEFLFFTMMSSEHLDASSSDIAQSNLQHRNACNFKNNQMELWL